MPPAAAAPAGPEDLEDTLAEYGFNAHAQAAVIAMGIDDVNELVDISFKGLKEAFVTLAKTERHASKPVKFKPTAIERTFALKTWLTARRSMGLPALLAGFTAAIRKEWVDHKRECVQQLEDQTKDLVAQFPLLTDAAHYPKWAREVELILRFYRGHQVDTPLVYLIRTSAVPSADDRARDFDDIDTQLIVLIGFEGAQYKADNKLLYIALARATKDSKDLSSAVTRHSGTLNGRGAWVSLRDTAFGEDAKNQQCLKLRTDIGRARFSGNSRQNPFTAYVETWQQFLLNIASLDPEKGSFSWGDFEIVRKFCAGIQHSKLDNQIISALADPVTSNDFEATHRRLAAAVGALDEQGVIYNKTRPGRGISAVEKEQAKQAAKISALEKSHDKSSNKKHSNAKHKARKPTYGKGVPGLKLDGSFIDMKVFRQLSEAQRKENLRLREIRDRQASSVERERQVSSVEREVAATAGSEEDEAAKAADRAKKAATSKEKRAGAGAGNSMGGRKSDRSETKAPTVGFTSDTKPGAEEPMQE